MFTKTDIYRYAVGEIEVYADPLTVRRHLLMVTSGRCWEWAKKAKEYEGQLEKLGDATGEASDAQRAEWSKELAVLDGELATAAYQAFGLEAVDSETGIGTTETEALEIMYGYLGWLEKKDERPNG